MSTASPARRLGPALAALLWIGSARPGAAQDIGVGFSAPVVELLPVGAPRRDWTQTFLSDGNIVVRHVDQRKTTEMADAFAATVALYAR